MDGIEKSYADVSKGYVPQEWVVLLEKSIIKEREVNYLGVIPRSHKENKRNNEDPCKKIGRQSNKQRVVEAGRRLVESSQYPSIKESLGL